MAEYAIFCREAGETTGKYTNDERYPGTGKACPPDTL